MNSLQNSTNSYHLTSEKLISYGEMFEHLKKNKRGAFIPFIVAGDPDFETSLEIVKILVESGADALEIGFPFSDPVADGPIIQEANLRALNSGMTTEKCFQFIKRIREFTSIPIGLLVYYNLIYKRGVNAFYHEAEYNGINSILSADLPPEEANNALNAAKKYDIDQIFLVAQNTPLNRLKYINNLASGFIYVVSIMGVTGVRNKIKKSTANLITRIRAHTDLPILVGFGISKPEHIKAMIQYGADGTIVGSSLIKVISQNLEEKESMLQKIKKEAKIMKDATKNF